MNEIEYQSNDCFKLTIPVATKAAQQKPQNNNEKQNIPPWNLNLRSKQHIHAETGASLVVVTFFELFDEITSYPFSIEQG